MKKTDKSIVLPLLEDVGQALIDYIKFGRPVSDSNVIFLRHISPIKPISAPGMTAIVKRYANKAGVDSAPGHGNGLHAMRSYLASALLAENVPLTVSDIRLQKPATVKITGKGNKTRIIPIMDSMVTLLKQYLKEFGLMVPEKSRLPLFLNRSGEKLTRKGVTYIYQKYFIQARETEPGLFPEKMSPHCCRHSKSMHLLQSGVDLIYICDMLGHVDVKTTEIYARIDSEMKRKTLEKGMNIIPANKEPVWQTNKELLTWLNSLGR